ncbi:MAG TPA: ATP-binding cassette domain-containing protein [Lacunisphaera sp.]|jgi:iron complex transport system ATP-binding protein|nr:ATP-binding cassette domain-containing protein [Lacunisphaera sp.]
MPSPSAAPLLFDFRDLDVYRGDRRILQAFNLQVRRGEHVALFGPNGCGKSTLIKTLTRELYPVDRPGLRFQVLGRDDWDVYELRRLLGIVTLDLLHQLSHEVVLRTVTGRELVLSGHFGSVGLWPHQRVTPAQERRAREVLGFLDIAHLADRPISEMSAGEQRRAVIGRALVHDPAALILDEPTNSLDPGAVREFRLLLRKLIRAGKTLVLVTHHVSDLVPEIERVILLRSGRVVADGPPARIVTSSALSCLFGTRLQVVHRAGRFSLVAR